MAVLAVFPVSAGDFTISRRLNVLVPRFLRFPRLTRFRPFLLFFAVTAGDFTVSRRPNVHVPRFLRFPRLTRFRPFSPVLAVFAVPAADFTRFGWSALVISPYPYGTERARSTFPLFSMAYTLPPFADSDTTLGHFISFWAFKPPLW